MIFLKIPQCDFRTSPSIHTVHTISVLYNDYAIMSSVYCVQYMCIIRYLVVYLVMYICTVYTCMTCVCTVEFKVVVHTFSSSCDIIIVWLTCMCLRFTEALTLMLPFCMLTHGRKFKILKIVIL